MVDGGTRFVAHLTKKFAPTNSFQRSLRALRSGPTRRDVDLWPDAGPLDEPPMAHVTVSGAHRHILTFYVEDQCWFRWNDETRDLHVQLKAKGLWTYGYGEVMPYWLGWLAQCFTGRTDDDAIAELFKCTGLELCCDFTGLQFYREDAGNFLGARINGDSGAAELPRDVWGDRECQRVETINVGRRTANLSLCIYDKLAQVDAVKDGDRSTYESTHREHGWDGSSRITRVEMRFAKEGMIWRDCRGVTLDLSDPWTLCDRTSLGEAWGVGCQKRCLIVPGTATRRERCKSDPRWDEVAARGILEEDRGHWRQERRVQKDTHRERVKRARRSACQGMLRYAALHGLRVDEYESEGIAEIWEDMAAGSEVDFGEFLRRYSRSQTPLLGEEITRAREAFEERRLARGGRARDHPPQRSIGRTGADLFRAIERQHPPKA